MVYIQEPGKCDDRACERSQPLTAVDCALPVAPEAHRHGGLLNQDFRPCVLAITVGVYPVLPVCPAVGGKVTGDGCNNQAGDCYGAAQGGGYQSRGRGR